MQSRKHGGTKKNWSSCSRVFVVAFSGFVVSLAFITVVPSLDMVVAHKTDTAGQKAVSARQFDAVLRMLVAAKSTSALRN